MATTNIQELLTQGLFTQPAQQPTVDPRARLTGMELLTSEALKAGDEAAGAFGSAFDTLRKEYIGLTPEEQLGEELQQLNLETPEGLTRLAEIQRMTGDLEGSLQTLGTLQGMAQSASQRETFSDYLETNYPNSGLDKLAEQGLVTPDNLNDFLEKEKGSTKTQGKRYTIRDAEGNMFAASTSFDKGSGAFNTVYAPLGNTTSDKPKGDIEVITEEGVTFEEKQKAKVSTANQIDNDERFNEARMGALGAKFEIEDNLIGLNETLSLLDSVPTGGPITNVAGSITKFLGTTPADRSELEFRLASRVLSNLKSTFGGVISEGEREYLIDISANIKKGNKGNRAIIENLLEIQQRAKKRNDLLLSARNFDEYNDVILGYGFEDITADSEGDNVINFEDL